MHWLLTTALLGTLTQGPLEPGLHNTTIDVDEVGTVTYGILIPRGYDPVSYTHLTLPTKA